MTKTDGTLFQVKGHALIYVYSKNILYLSFSIHPVFYLIVFDR